jgi:hypothetical protein
VIDYLDLPRGELEQALDCRLTSYGLEGLALGDLIVASAACGGYPIPFLARLAAGGETAVEQWAGQVVLRELAVDLGRAHTERLFRELFDEDGGPA